MISKEKLDRINELARRQREGVLTQDEVREQAQLRREYVKAFRGNMELQLQSMGLEKKVAHNSSKGCQCGCQHKH